MNKPRCILASLAVMIITSLLITVDTFATNAGPGGVNPGGCTSGNCVNASSNGAAWVRIAYNSNNSVSLKSLLRNLSGYLGINDYSDSTVSNCKNSGGYVYTLVTPFSGSDNFTGPVPMNIPGTGKIYDGFTNRTIPSVVAPATAIDIFNNAATNGKINGYAYADDSTMSWFCGAADVAKETTFQGHTTISVADGAKTIRSGWDKFKSDTYETTSASVKLTFTHKLKRTDDKNVGTNVKWKLATADDGLSSSRIGANNDRTLSFSASEHNTKDAETTEYTINIDPGTTKTICQGINHELKVKVKSDGTRTSDQPGDRGSAKACVIIKRKGVEQQNPSSASTNNSFIGENSTLTKSGAHTIYFYVGNSVNKPSDSQVAGGGTQNYGEGEGSNPGADDAAAANNAICNNFRSLCRTYVEATSNDITIPDDANLVGAKVCAASSSKNSVFKETRTRTKSITYADADGNSVEEEVTEEYDVYTYYWKFSDLSCSPIFKRPNFQVLGGALYSSGKITTSKSSKVADGPAQGKTYGSWSEYLAVAGNTIKNLGSGASLRSGSTYSSLTKNSPLTIANVESGHIGYSGIDSSSSTNFINALKTRFIDSGKYNHDSINVIYHEGDYTLSLADLASDKHNIIYAQNISIPAGVTQVNAWLIAEDTINTCAEATSISALSADICHQSLTINGIAYAKNFKLYRTAGALAGNDSAVPAETFNLTAGDYDRAYRHASTEYMQPAVVYTQELAPRL